VVVGVDHRRERPRGFDAVVEVEPQLAQHRQLGPEPGRHDHLVGVERACAVAQLEAAAGVGDLERLETRRQLDRAALQQAADGGAERATGRQLVVGAAAERVAERRSPHGPDDLGGRFAVAQRGQVQQRVERRVARADHEHPPAGVAVAVRAEDVGDAVRDPVGVVGLAGGGQPAGAERVGRGPGAGGVDHGAREQPLLAPVGVDDHLERRVVAAVVLELVDAELGDGDHPRAVADAVAQRRQLRQRRDVAVGELGTGRVGVRVGRSPALGLQQLDGDGIGDPLPGREQAHVAPVAEAGCIALAGFEHERVEVADEQVRGRRHADRAGADDDRRKGDRFAHGTAPQRHRRILMRCTVAHFRQGIKILRYPWRDVRAARDPLLPADIDRRDVRGGRGPP
jgi:hypothetical protein